MTATAIPSDAEVASLLNAAIQPLRALPRVVPKPAELPVYQAAHIAARRADAWLDNSAFTIVAGQGLVSLVELRVEGEQALLGALATHPARQREGLAARNLQEALQAAREAGAKRVQTAAFVDSRNLPACAFLEQAGFSVRDPEQHSIVMQIDMAAYQPLAVELPAGYRIETLRPEWVAQWVEVKNRVFESGSPPEWFASTFSDRPDFEWEGWKVLFHGAEMIGIAAADLHRDPAPPRPYSGCQIEYVGVYAEHRGLRLGEMMVVACLNHAQARRVRPCQLITQPFRVPAVRLYERLGCTKVRENRIYEREL